MNRMLLVAVAAIEIIIVGIAITGCGCTLQAADDIRVLGGISVAIMVAVLVTFLYIIHIYDMNPEYSYHSEGRYL